MADERPVKDIRPGKHEFIWKGPLYEKTAVPVWYYVLIILIGVVLGAVFISMSQPLSVLVVAASLLFFVTHANDVPKAFRYTITDRGIGIDSNEFSYGVLKSFWMSESPTINTLYVEQLGRFSIPLSIPISRADVAGIRSLLRQHLPESKRTDELFMDTIARLTGLL